MSRISKPEGLKPAQVKARALWDAYYSLRIGTELTNDQAWALWAATDADKAAINRLTREMAEQLDRDFGHTAPEKAKPFPSDDYLDKVEDLNK